MLHAPATGRVVFMLLEKAIS